MLGDPRIMARRWSHWCLVFLTAGSVYAAEPVPSSQVDAEAVKPLLKQLESERAAERAVAAKELVALGAGVLPHLPPPERMETAAARDVIVQVRNVLERKLARDSAHAATVTLSGTASREELCVEIARQTGNPLGMVSPHADQPLKVDWQRRSFWRAVDSVMDATTETVSWHTSTARFVIEPRLPGTKSVAEETGAFRVEVRMGTVKPGQGDESPAVLRVNTLWQAEPRLRPLFLRIKPGDWRGAMGEKMISAWNPDADYELPFADGTRQLAWPLDVVWPNVGKAKNWSLHGRAVVHLAAMTETITFDAVALRPNVQRRRGGVSVRIRAVDFQPDDNNLLNATIRIQVTYDTGGPAFESHRTWVFYQGANLRGPQGERISFSEYEATQEANGAVGVEYRFHKLPGRSSDYVFAYDAPTLFLDVPLNITFRDLPIPEPGQE